MPYHSRATEKLLAGRVSAAGAWYFLTWCTHNRAKALTAPAVHASLHAAIAGLENTRDGVLLAATVMPDHVHLLLALGDRLTVSPVVAKIKSTVTREHQAGQWQLNFFEHRLRDASASEGFAFYIFMNPYVAELGRLDEIWPGWVPSRNIRWSFEDKLREGIFPHAEWLTEARCFARALPAGAD